MEFTLEQVLEQEAKLQFDEFKHEDALNLALLINEEVKNNYEKPVGIRVVHQGLEVFHFLMNERKRPATWLVRKAKTVNESGHSSLYTFLKMEAEPKFKAWQGDDNYAICGGGFPLIENGEVTGSICVSGLEHWDDHAVIVKCLKQYLNK